MSQVIIIAEAGVNHNGSLDMAIQLIDAAADAGADYIKFQTFKTEQLVSAAAERAEYQKRNMAEDQTSTQFDMLKKLELSEADHLHLMSHCKTRNIKFLSTAFDLASLEFLHSLGLDLFKIPSGEITNLPYLLQIGGYASKVIISTGMCVMEEIKDAIDVLIAAGTVRNDITILHCTSDYPTPFDDVNLRAMLNIGNTFNLPVGYSDHTEGIEVPIAAVALGASVIEKHFTLDKNLPGPDHKASLNPVQLKDMVSSIRNIERALGTDIKRPTEAEEKNRLLARKSIHLARKVEANTVLSKDDLVMKRPGDGISAMLMMGLVGRRVAVDLPAEHKIRWEDLLA